MKGRVVAVFGLLVSIWGSGAAAQMPSPFDSTNETEPEAPNLILPGEMTNPSLDSEAFTTNPSLGSDALSTDPSSESGELAPGDLGDPTYVSPGEGWQAPYSVEGGETLDAESN